MAWRADATSQINKGKLRAPSSITLREAATAWLEGAHVGTIRNRPGDEYKPSVLRGYEAALEGRILKELGARRLSDISRADGEGHDPARPGEGTNWSHRASQTLPPTVTATLESKIDPAGSKALGCFQSNTRLS
jgi:hypothetical protein